jgi:hypothetical protein
VKDETLRRPWCSPEFGAVKVALQGSGVVPPSQYVLAGHVGLICGAHLVVQLSDSDGDYSARSPAGRTGDGRRTSNSLPGPASRSCRVPASIVRPPSKAAVNVLEPEGNHREDDTHGATPTGEPRTGPPVA